MRIGLLSLLFLLACCQPIQAQQIQILRPDSSLFDAITLHDYITLVTLLPRQQGWLKRRQPLTGQVIQITHDSLTLRTRTALIQLPIDQIQGLRKISKLKAYLRNPNSIVTTLGIITVTQVVTRTLATEGTVGRRFAIGVGVSIGVLSLLNLAVHGPGLKRTQKGWIFRVVA